MSAQDEIERLKTCLKLQPYPSGFGSFLETWRGDRQVSFITQTSHDGPRSTSTSVYFLLEAKSNIPVFKQLSDELFYWHAGGAMKLHLISADGKHTPKLLGNPLENPEFQYFVPVPHGTWYAAELINESPYIVFSAVVAPGWELRDRTDGKLEDLLKQFPQHKDILEKFCKT